MCRVTRPILRAIAERHADTLRDGNALSTPAETAAEWVDGANGRAAEFVGAARIAVHHKRRTSSGAVVDTEVAAEHRIGGAGFIPCARAAGRIEHVADVRAASFVFATWEVARNGAGARARVAAGNSTIEAVGACIDHAEDVPLDFAARRIDDADVVAALAIKAAWRFVWIEATARVDRAALIAVLNRKIGARLIPTAKRAVAARRIDDAHGAAACGLRAALAAVREEATARCARARGVDVWARRQRTLRECDLHASEVPFDFAAEHVEVAHSVTAARIVAAWALVHGAAARVLERHIHAAKAARNVAVVGRQLGAEFVPAERAAEGVDVADRFAADGVVAEGRWLRIAATARAGIAAAAAEALSPVHAGLIPCRVAAAGVDTADGLAALRIAAVRILMHHEAGACRPVAAIVGEFDRLLDAAFVPTHRAAVFKTNRGADGLADLSVVAGWSRVRLEARVLHKTAVGAVLLGDGDAHVVPSDVAARGLRGANESAAHWVAATSGKEVGGEAVVGRVAAGVLSSSALKPCERSPRGCDEQHQTAE